MIIFSKKHIRPNITLTLYNTPIQISDKIKFLGITFDTKLTWVPHINSLVDKCHKSLRILRVVSCTKWGADRSTLLLFYRAYTRSLLDYGCIAYSSAKSRVLEKLNTIHNTGLRLVTGAFRSSPGLSLCAETGEMPLDYRRKLICIKFFLKCIYTSSPCMPFLVDNTTLCKYYQNSKRARPLSVRYLTTHKVHISNTPIYTQRIQHIFHPGQLQTLH